VSAAVCSLLCASCARWERAPYDDYIGPVDAAPRGAAVQDAPTSRPSPLPTSRPALPAGPLDLTVREALLLALENNQGLRVERLNPPIRRTAEERARAAFDPVVSADLNYTRERAERTDATTRSETISGTAGVDTLFPTGTTVTAQAGGSRVNSSPGDDAGSARVGLTVTQALLEGRGRDVNLASLRQARLDVQVSEYELRGVAEALLADVESTYWDYVLAERQIAIYIESLKLADKQLAETEERIKVGKLAETERAAAQAEVALRREALINARSALATTRLRLLRLVNPPGADLWQRDVAVKDQPGAPTTTLDDVEDHVKLALRMRPEVNQAQLAIQRGDLELVRTRNGLLPKLDLFITLGKTGYADSFSRAVGDLDGPGYEAALGLRFSQAVGNRDDRARHRRAVLDREQAAEAFRNLTQLVQVEVRSAHIEVNRAKEQVAATAATRRFKEETLRSETEKFRVGRSTSLLVAAAQRDLVGSQIAEIEALVNHLKALIDLYRLDGSLLDRRGIVAPGRQPLTGS